MGLVLLLIVAVAVISNFWPKTEDQFIQLGLLGPNKIAEDYFVNDNPNLAVGTQVSWYIYVNNQMTNSQNIIVKVKLLNSTMQQPNDTTHNPSPENSIIDFPESLNVNGTQLIPFNWSIADIAPQGNSIAITTLIINGQTVNVNVPITPNTPLCMVFELWVYNQSSHEYAFDWESANQLYSASVTMWFNLT